MTMSVISPGTLVVIVITRTCSISRHSLFPSLISFQCIQILWVNFLNEFSITFHIEIAYDTIQSLNYVVDQVFSKNFPRLLMKSTYVFSSMVFLCFVINEHFHVCLFIDISLLKVLVSSIRGLHKQYFWYSSWIHDMIWMSNNFVIILYLIIYVFLAFFCLELP